MSASSSELPPRRRVSADPLHRRIAIVGWAVIPLLILLAPTFFLWLGYRLVSCPSDVSQTACKWGITVPLIPSGLIVACLVVAILTLHQHGRQTLSDSSTESLSRISPRRVTHYVRGGYRGLRPTHKRHVRRTILFFASALGAFVGFWAYYFGLPALPSMIIGGAVVILAIGFNRWVELPTPSAKDTAMPAEM